MNQKELQQMLSQVDEKYIAEIIDAEETTSEAVTITKRSRRFSGWTAIAAAVCVCVVGGGCLVWTQANPRDMAKNPQSQAEDQHSTAQSGDTALEERLEYDLIWETVPEEKMVIDYTWEAGGEHTFLSQAALPFETAQFSAPDGTGSAVFYFDENGTPANVSVLLQNDENSIFLTLSDRGRLFPPYFEVDLSKDAAREKPAIHIYETSENTSSVSYELYYLHNGIGLSMEVSGYSAEEAEQFAAAFLQGGYSVQKLWEDNDFGKYFTLESPVLVSADFSMETKGGTAPIGEESPFSAIAGFTGGTYYLHEDGSAANMELHYETADGQHAQVIISNTSKMYAHGQLTGDGGVERDGVTLFGSRTEDGGSILSCNINCIEITDNGMVRCIFNGWDCEITCFGMSDAEVIAFYDSIAETLKTISGIENLAAESDFFFRDVSEITQHRTDFVWNGLHATPITDPGIPTELELVSAEIRAAGDGMAQFAVMQYGTEERSANIFLNAHGDMGSVFPITGESDGKRYGGIMFYGFSDANDPAHKELFFVTEEGLGCHLLCNGMTEEEILTLAKDIIGMDISLQVMLEKKTSAEMDYIVEWGTAKKIPATPNRNAGGKYDIFGTGTAAFPADSVSGYIYRDENGTPVNILVRTRVSEQQEVFYTLSDAEEFYLQYCDADTSGDADSGKPVIHIVETKDSTGLTVHELYFQYPGTAVSMMTYNCTAEEALAYAEILLRDQPTAVSAAETVSDRESIDRGDYLLVWDRGTVTYVDLAKPYNPSGRAYDIHTKIEPPEMPFDVGAYTDFTGILYHDTENTPFAVYLEYKTEKGSIKIQINDAEHPFMSPSGSLSCKGLSEEYGKPVILGLEIDDNHHRLCYTLDGTTVVVNATGYTAGEAEQMIAAIFGEKMTAKELPYTAAEN